LRIRDRTFAPPLWAPVPQLVPEGGVSAMKDAIIWLTNSHSWDEVKAGFVAAMSVLGLTIAAIGLGAMVGV
jgi:hypothetical protein